VFRTNLDVCFYDVKRTNRIGSLELAWANDNVLFNWTRVFRPWNGTMTMCYLTNIVSPCEIDQWRCVIQSKSCNELQTRYSRVEFANKLILKLTTTILLLQQNLNFYMLTSVLVFTFVTEQIVGVSNLWDIMSIR